MQRALDLARLEHRRRLEDHRQIERLDLGLDAVLEHLGGEPLDQLRRILVNPGRKVHRPGRERGHVGLERKHAAALLACTRAATGRELRDDSRAVLADAFEYLAKAL